MAWERYTGCASAKAKEHGPVRRRNVPHSWLAGIEDARPPARARGIKYISHLNPDWPHTRRLPTEAPQTRLEKQTPARGDREAGLDETGPDSDNCRAGWLRTEISALHRRGACSAMQRGTAAPPGRASVVSKMVNPKRVLSHFAPPFMGSPEPETAPRVSCSPVGGGAVVRKRYEGACGPAESSTSP
jgi:hypothetical protein